MDEQEQWWVVRAQTGDREACEALLKALKAPLGRYLERLLGNTTLAEDALQQTLVVVWRKLYWLQNPSLLRPWAYRIAHREALALQKKERRWREQVREEVLLENLPEAPLVSVELEKMTLLEHLSPASRAVLLLHYEQGFRLEEVAQILDIPLGTVRYLESYAMGYFSLP